MTGICRKIASLSYGSKIRFLNFFRQSIPICLYFWSMQYGICPLSIVPLRAEPKDTSEQTSQLLYGEFFTVDKRKSWSKIQNESDGYEGWVNNKHFLLIEKPISKSCKIPQKYIHPNSLILFGKETKFFFLLQLVVK